MYIIIIIIIIWKNVIFKSVVVVLFAWPWSGDEIVEWKGFHDVGFREVARGSTDRSTSRGGQTSSSIWW
jgi:hypothetical protein